jgi:virginiamycin B lyase
LVAVTTEPPGANCTLGGLRVDTGLDSDDSGVLEAAEIQHTAYVCAVAGGGSAGAGGASLDAGAAGTGGAGGGDAGTGGSDAGTGGSAGGTACSTLTEFDLPAPVSALTAGPDQNLWLASNASIIRMTTAGVFTTFPTASAIRPQIIAGSDGNVWWDELPAYALGRITPDGVITRSDVIGATGISVGPGAGYVWYTRSDLSALNRITPAGQIWGRTLFRALGEIVHANGGFWGITAGGIGFVTDYDAEPEHWGANPPPAPVALFPTSYAPSSVAAGPDGTVWFTTSLPPGPTAAVKIGRISPSGELREFQLGGTRAARPAVAPDGAAWTLFESVFGGFYLARYTPSGEMTMCQLPSAGGVIALGPDQRMWFTEGSLNRIAAFTP